MRDSFIIYRSFYEAISDLPKENQAEIWEAICEYSLNFKDVELTGINATVFKLIKPQLDANNKRFENGKAPKQKQFESKTEAKQKQTISKSEAKVKQDRSKVEANVNDNVNVNNNLNVNNNVNDNKKNIPHLFINSEFIDLDKFKNQFIGTKYDVCDLEYYYEAVKNWSDSAGAKKIDWIATAKNFMLKDSQENKLKLKDGTKQQNADTPEAQARRVVERIKNKQSNGFN